MQQQHLNNMMQSVSSPDVTGSAELLTLLDFYLSPSSVQPVKASVVNLVEVMNLPRAPCAAGEEREHCCA